MDILEEMYKLLKMFNLPRLKQEEIKTISKPVTSTEIETVIKVLQQTKDQSQMASQFNSI